MIDPKLLDYATARQNDYLQAWLEHGSAQAAAAMLGVETRDVTRALTRAVARAAQRGYSPDADKAGLAPDGYTVRGKSTLYTADGRVAAQWVKTQKDAVSPQRVADEIVAALEVPPAVPVDAPDVADYRDDVVTVYPIGDAHIGMLAWHEETEDDHDMRIAERELTTVCSQLVQRAPASRMAWVIDVGDFFHADNYEGVTSRSGHRLDCDSRYPKMIRIGVGIAKALIRNALEKHERVVFVAAGGNHDDQSSILFAMILQEHFRTEPRVSVVTELNHYKYLRFGKCLVGVTHGNNAKYPDLPGIMATDRPADWGATLHRYWYTGHVHHDQRKEFRGCMVESFRTLARRDAWHHTKGYRSGRDMKAIVLHAEHGEILRHTIGLPNVTKQTINYLGK